MKYQITPKGVWCLERATQLASERGAPVRECLKDALEEYERKVAAGELSAVADFS